MYVIEWELIHNAASWINNTASVYDTGVLTDILVLCDMIDLSSKRNLHCSQSFLQDINAYSLFWQRKHMLYSFLVTKVREGMNHSTNVK